jgi:protein MpaA
VTLRATALAITVVLCAVACAGRTESGSDASIGGQPSIEPAEESTPLFAATTAPPTTRLPATSNAPTTSTTSTTSTTPAESIGRATSTSASGDATAGDAPRSTEQAATSAPPSTVLTDPIVCDAGESDIWDVRPPSDLPPPPLPAGWTTAVVGTSVQGRDITALVHPVDSPRRRVLVIGGLHGNEPVSPPTVRSFVEAARPDDHEVWLVAEANPDGVAAGTRCNANGVDLNRNFDWTWRADDGGPAPLSEPEVQTLVRMVQGLQPDVVVWVHQPYGYVSSIGPTPDSLEQAWAVGANIRVRPDTTQHGGGESWTAFVAGRPSMLIEIDSWAATPEIVATHRAGFEAMLAALG